MQHFLGGTKTKTLSLLAWNLLGDLLRGDLDDPKVGDGPKPAMDAARAALRFFSGSSSADDELDEDDDTQVSVSHACKCVCN